MKKINAFCAITFIFAAAGLLSAQKARRAETRFTSSYTSLNKGCKVIRGTNGSDGASICYGPGGYRVRVYSSAAAVLFNAEVRGTNESFPLGTASIGFDESKTRVEWRLADGKPFAAIIRLPKYGDPTADDPYFGKTIGQELIVRGLRGFKGLDSAVDAKSPDANSTARSVADKAYLAGRQKYEHGVGDIARVCKPRILASRAVNLRLHAS